MEKIPTGVFTPHVLREQQILWIKDLITVGKGKGLTPAHHVTSIMQEFRTSRIHAFKLYAATITDMGESTLTKAEFDIMMVEDLLTALNNPFLPANERRRMWETIAKIKGYYVQIAAKDVVVPANMSHPEVLKAALALDELISQAEGT